MHCKQTVCLQCIHVHSQQVSLLKQFEVSSIIVEQTCTIHRRNLVHDKFSYRNADICVYRSQDGQHNIESYLVPWYMFMITCKLYTVFMYKMMHSLKCFILIYDLCKMISKEKYTYWHICTLNIWNRKCHRYLLSTLDIPGNHKWATRTQFHKII